MRNIFRTSLLGLGALASAVWGHHSFAAEFDIHKTVSLTGVVGKLDWMNPHAYVYLDVKEASGTTKRWAFQTLPPGMMKARGVSRDMFAVGQTMTISGFGAKDGTQNLGWIKKIQYADGRILQVTAEEEENK